MTFDGCFVDVVACFCVLGKGSNDEVEGNDGKKNALTLFLWKGMPPLLTSLFISP